MAVITVELLTDFTNKLATKITEKFVKKTDIPEIPEDAVFTDTTYSNATSSTAGLMSAADKTKLDGLEEAEEADIDSILTDAFK